MSRSITLLTAAVCALALCATAPAQRVDSPNDQEVLLVKAALSGESLVEGEKALSAYLAEHPRSDYVRFGLGLTQFFHSGEVLFSNLYRYGFLHGAPFMEWIVPIDPSSVPQNPQPEPLTYAALNEMIESWQAAVARSEATLAQITDDHVKLRVYIGQLRLDINGDGRGDESEAIWALFNRFQGRFDASEQGAAEFAIAFDRADVSWLRGYCHFIMALTDAALAHDREALFNHCSHLAFAKPETPFPFLQKEYEYRDYEWMPVSDWVAFFHLMQFEVREPKRLLSAHEHLKMVIAMGREMWKHIDAETDNDREWIPSSIQNSVIPGAEVTPAIRDTWLMFLDEADLVLDGKRLVRFWRMPEWDDRPEGMGINLKRVFTEPRRFDLVLWIQGTAAAPYLEQGTLTKPGLWSRMEDAFNGRVFRWGFWFN
ncbi:MAG: hypothetical protein IT430_00420 [Phycisphaerales bacterium]|nr:hypothetical protein [Phycisphaerales bacterium]